MIQSLIVNYVSAIEFYDNDPDLPIISSMDHGYPVHLIIEELLSNVNETRPVPVKYSHYV